MRALTVKRRHAVAAAAALCGLLLTSCSSGAGGSDDKAKHASPQEPKPLSASQLQPLLLTQQDLGTGYVQELATTAPDNYDDVAMEGCPSLEKLGRDDAKLKFAANTDVSFTYDARATLGEELHSDRPAVLSAKIREIFGAYTACSSFTMTSGTTPIKVKVSKSATPQVGDEQFAYTSTMELPSGPQILKTLAVRKGSVAVILVGAPALVDRHITNAVNKLPKGR
ncbi:hypothetical protein ABZ864_40760 [Streptomyces sp. NPDC047082]|uniref:hypothetical protein n=1 Tax=Streptomyces sp. NPDC047082 TaxID=3155259 RepID=UPI0033ED44DB